MFVLCDFVSPLCTCDFYSGILCIVFFMYVLMYNFFSRPQPNTGVTLDLLVFYSHINFHTSLQKCHSIIIIIIIIIIIFFYQCSEVLNKDLLLNYAWTCIIISRLIIWERSCRNNRSTFLSQL